MKDRKRLLSKVIAFAIIFTSVDLSWLSLSPIVTYAEGATNDVVDAYKAVERLKDEEINGSYKNTYAISNNVKNAVGTTPEGISPAFNNNYKEVKNNSLVFKFQQSNIDGTAQVKSGEWLNNTTYEAMAGTPTTESLFVSYGGTQWIVDLEYRLNKASYERKYHFDAGAANYLYYKLGPDPAKTDEMTNNIYYIGMKELDAEDFPTDYTDKNYGLKLYDASTTNAVIRAKAKADNQISSVAGNSNAEYTPTVAKAIAYKQSCIKATDKLQEMWDAQDDNYRVDQGIWDEEGDVHLPDRLNFMYTYGGMMRHGANKDNSDSDASAVFPKGKTGSYANALCTTYLNDWDGYSEVDSMTAAYRSDICIPPTCAQSGTDARTVLTTGFNFDTLAYKDSGAALGAATNDFLRIQGTFGNFSDVESNGALLDYAYNAWVTDPGEVLNFAAPLSYVAAGNNGGLSAPAQMGMNIITGSHVRAGSCNLDGGAYAELAHRYYRSMYAIAMYMDAFFFSDEECLCPGLPGHDHSRVNDNAVAEYINLVFHTAETSGTVNVDIKVPFAILPVGGDLDATTTYTSLNPDSLPKIDGIPSDSLCCLLTTDYINYAYCVDIGARVDYGWDYDYTEKEYYTERHGDLTTSVGNTDYCGNNGQDVGVHTDKLCDTNKKVTCTTCNGTGITGAAACTCGTTTSTHASGCAYSAGTTCSTCSGTGKTTCSHTLEKHKHYTGTQSCLQSSSHSGSWLGKTTDEVFSTITNGGHEQKTLNVMGNNYLHSPVATGSRVYREVYPVVSYYTIRKCGELGAGGYYGGFVESPKSMSNSQVITQRFDNVEWLDITSYKLWHIDSATSKGLSKMLVRQTTITNLANGSDSDITNTLVTKAVAKKGYTVYNLDDNLSGVGITDPYTIVSTPNTPLRNLQTNGRLANSFNPGSIGNNGNATITQAQAADKGYTSLGVVIKSRPYVAYRNNDCPYLKIGEKVNNDFAAYKLSRMVNDDLYFTYNPYSQGGRSHTCFAGFVTQALAHTLLHNDGESVDFTSTSVKKAYENSIRVQGDYLAVGRWDTNGFTTVAGQMYDTWVQRNDSDKFKLIKDNTELDKYLSHCTWIPAKLSFILGRTDIKELYQDLDSTDNNFMIHTYCRGFNGATHSVWDSIKNCADCGNGSSGSSTDLGQVNYEIPGSRLGRSCDNTFDLATITLNGGTRYNGLDVVDLGNYLSKGVNTITTCTVDSLALPYVGYQSEGNGTQDITLNGGNNTQSGYSLGEVPAFNSNHTYVSDSPLDGGFKQFGINTGAFDSEGKQIGITTSVGTPTVTNDVASNCDTNIYANEFYKKYPWLLGLNVNRYQDNGIYDTGTAVINYTARSQLVTDNLQADVDTPADTQGYKVNAEYLLGNRQQDDNGNPNQIVIYNPVSTEASVMVPLSNFRPNSSNGASTSNKTNKDYLTSSNNVLRNQVIFTRRNTVNITDREMYFIGGEIKIGTTTETGNKKFVLLPQSNVETTAYMYDDDYEVNPTTKTYTGQLKLNDEYEIEADGEYTFSYTSSTSQSDYVYGSIRLKKNYILKVSDCALWLDWTPGYIGCEWNSFVTAYLNSKDLTKTEDGRYLNSIGDEVTLEFNPDECVPFSNSGTYQILGSAIEMPAGAVIELKLRATSDKDGNNNITNTPFVLTSGNTNINVLYTGVDDEGLHSYYIESLHDTVLSDLSITCTMDCYIRSFANTCVTTHDAYVMGFDNTISNYVTDANYIGYMFGNMDYSKGNTSRDAVGINSNLFVSLSILASLPSGAGSIDADTYYVTYTETNNCTVDIKSESIADPHKVMNKDWRYYVLGWKYEDGTYVTSLVDTTDKTTVLISPMNERITVGSLETKADNGFLYAVSINGKFYLWDRSFDDIDSDIDNGFKTIDTIQYPYLSFYHLTITGDTFFDTISFGPGGRNLDVNAPLDSQGTYNGGEYYIMFQVNNFSGSNNYAYDVKLSNNIAHKYTVAQEIEKRASVNQDYDYELINETITSIKDVTSENSNEYTYVSLDDEFTIHWDNLANLLPSAESETNAKNNITNLIKISENLGRGWDNSVGDNMGADTADDYDTADAVKASIDKYGDIALLSTSYSHWFEHDTTSDKLFDTTKWIADKYLVFNVDMYGFTTSDSYTLTDSNTNFDPTTPAYKSDGTPNNIVYIPAGTKVHLGKQVEDYTKEESDSGSFIDYGNKTDSSKRTNDPNGELYTYHFWCPLSNGETQDNAMVQFFVESINCSTKTECVINPSDSGSAYRSNVANNIMLEPLHCIVGTYKLVKQNDTKVQETDEWGDVVYDSVASPNIPNNSFVIVDTSLQSSADGNSKNYVCTLNSSQATRYTSSANYKSFSIVGSVGGLSVIDSGDPRWQDSFKIPSCNYAIAPIVYRVSKYSNREFAASEYATVLNNAESFEGTQRYTFGDITDVRGRVPNYGNKDFAENNYNTYGSQWFKRNYNLYANLPLQTRYNIHNEHNLENTSEAANISMSKLGYNLYCTLDTIGNYYGSSGKRIEDNANETTVNNNNDYGQTKIQIRPMYFYVHKDKVTGNVVSEPVDVYMRKGADYVIINSGMQKDENTQNNPESNYVDVMSKAYYPVSIKTNTSSDRKTLDQNMLRYSVTSREADSNNNVLSDIKSTKSAKAVTRGITKSILDSYDYDLDIDELGATSLTYDYSYGTAQLLFLREYNRTFIGGATTSLNESTTNKYAENAQLYGQKWYFSLGLPESAVFIPQGDIFTQDKILKESDGGYILVALDVYAVGEKWIMHYDSELSTIKIDIGDYGNVDYDTWSNNDPNKYLIPITYYELDVTTSSGDRTTQGSH